MERKHLGPFYKPKPYFGSVSAAAIKSESAAGDQPHPGALFGVAYATRRPCRCNSCICLTPEEKAYERRVFQLAKAWGRMLEAERNAAKAHET